MAHDEPPHQDLRCLQIQLFSSLVVKELSEWPPFFRLTVGIFRAGLSVCVFASFPSSLGRNVESDRIYS